MVRARRGTPGFGWRGHEGSLRGVRQGLDPKTNEFLRVRQSADRVAADGTKLAQGRSLYDFTISAPKSVSVMAILGEDQRLIDAHQTAVREALQELETYAASSDSTGRRECGPRHRESWLWLCIITTPAVNSTRNFTLTQSPRT